MTLIPELNELTTDETKVTDGVEVVINEKVGSKVWLRPMDIYANREYAARSREVGIKYAREMQLGKLSAEESVDIDIDTFVETCLIKWENVTTEAFTPELARRTLKKHPLLRRLLEQFAQDMTKYNEDVVVEGEAKNSPGTSPTSAG